MNDLTGKFGTWTIVCRYTWANGKKGKNYICQCDCGNEQKFRECSIPKLASLPCRMCSKKVRPSLVGTKFSKWTPVREIECRNCYICRCDCGEYGVVARGGLQQQTSTRCKSCGQRDYKASVSKKG